SSHQPAPLVQDRAGANRDIGGHVARPQGARLPFRRPNDNLCLHAVDRHGERPHHRLPSAHDVCRAAAEIPLAGAHPMSPRPAPAAGNAGASASANFGATALTSAETSAAGAPELRAWQRMLSGRRLDLLDPSPSDIAIEDIAHGLARVARWNGQTLGA